MPKGSHGSDSARTAGQPLREQLRELEIKLASMRRTRPDVEALLQDRDVLEMALADAEAQGLDTRAERGRLQTLDGLMRNQATRMMRLLAGVGGFAGARSRNAAPEGHWWWWLDLMVRERRTRSLRRTVIIVVCVAVVLLIADRVVNHFWGPTEEQSAFSDLTWEAERYILEGKLVEATRAYEQAVAYVADDAETLCTLAVLYEMQGRAEEATATLDAAERASRSRALLLFDYSRAQLLLGQTDRALQVAETAVAEDENSPYAYFALGNALQTNGDNVNATLAFDAAASLAMDQGEDVLYALARERQAVLLGGAH